MNLLVATDFSENSKAAVRLGAFLAQQLGSEMVLLHVVDLGAGDNAWRILVQTPEEVEQQSVVEAGEKLENFIDETLDERPEDLEFRVLLGNPIDELLDHAEKYTDPVFIAGTRGASRMKEIFLGNTSRRLVRRSEFPMILVPPKAEISTPKNLVVGVDFSDTSREAVRRAAMMARTYAAKLHPVYGYVLPEVATFDGSMASMSVATDDLVTEKKRALEKMVREVGADDVVDEVQALQLPPAQAVMSVAEDVDAQYIFMGTHGRRGISRFFLGNTAERVIRNAPCPIFVVRGPEEED